MKKFIKLIIYLLLFYLIVTNYNQIIKYILIIRYNDKLEFREDNGYSKKENWHYVQITDNFEPKNEQDIMNIIYTGLDRGYDEITFYCDPDYIECVEDMLNLINNSEKKITYIDNFLPTYNTFSHVISNANLFGRINLKIKNIYTDDQIKEINNRIDEIYPTIINDNMTDYEKIKAAHDYIINHTTYDDEAAEKIKNNDNNLEENNISSTAYGALINGKAVCDGYADTMALFLDKMRIRNFKIASTSHMWNAVYLDGKWLHLDVTWDDAPLENGNEILIYDYFLITTDELKNKDELSSHDFNVSIFDEVKS